MDAGLTSGTGAGHTLRHVCRAHECHLQHQLHYHDVGLREAAGFASMRGYFSGCTGTVVAASDHARL
jgi:photosystem II stability/assembly factor-like uncharacterized protein